MRYTQLSQAEVATMLDTIGAGSIAELFEVIPQDQRLKGELDLPAGLSEMELLADLERLAGRNQACVFWGRGPMTISSPRRWMTWPGKARS